MHWTHWYCENKCLQLSAEHSRPCTSSFRQSGQQKKMPDSCICWGGCAEWSNHDCWSNGYAGGKQCQSWSVTHGESLIRVDTVPTCIGTALLASWCTTYMLILPMFNYQSLHCSFSIKQKNSKTHSLHDITKLVSVLVKKKKFNSAKCAN